MPADDIDLLAISKGTVTAPAGCGKTHLIAEALTRHSGKKPILVLTHTNAGVVALRGRLDQAGVSANTYRLSTIDGWAMRLISTFPLRSAHDPKILNLARSRTDYPAIREAAWTLLKSRNVSDVLKASYSRLIVDEYQDCAVSQHAIVYNAARTLPTCVLGDPMQAIFGFQGNELADWDKQVCVHFPLIGELSTPWRWKNVGTDKFGLWLLEARRKLIERKPIDLKAAPPEVTWVHLDGADDHKVRLIAARTRAPNGDGHVLIIGNSKSPPSQQEIASQTPGAVTVENVDLKDLVNFAQKVDLESSEAFEDIIAFAANVMTNVGASDLVRRVRSLQRGTARKDPTNIERAALSFIDSPSQQALLDLFAEIGKDGGVRAHRPAVLRACIKALNACDGKEGNTFYDAAVRAREQSRLLGRPLPKRAVGSTLLLKGLEADVSVILDADQLDARHLYVAITRGSRALVVCSSSPILNPTYV